MKRILTVIAALIIGTTAVNAAALSKYQPGFRLVDGSQLNLMVAAVNNLTGNGTAGPVTATSLSYTTTLTGISANAACLSVGPAGNTNPSLRVVCSTASAATGLQVTSAAAAGGVALATISSGTNENLTIDAKGSGTVTINGTGTGNIVMGRAVTGVSTSLTGGFTAYSGTATPAAASAVAALTMGSAGITLTWGTGTPSIAAPQGSIYIQTDGSSSSTRLFVRGSSTWIAVTTAS